MKKSLFIITCLSLSIAACKTAQEAPKAETVAIIKPALDCSTQGGAYADIKPIIDQHCTSCHGYNGADGLNFLTVVDVRKAAKEGELVGCIKHQKGFPNMPANAAQLNQADIDKIECWVNNGMKD